MDKITLPCSCRPTLALGADTANVICFAAGKEALVSEQLKDLSYLEDFERFKVAIHRILNEKTPEIIVCDMHPGYHSTQYAERLSREIGCGLVKAQHHKAHAAAVALEYELDDYVGIVCDGLGYGEDGHLWGGEVLHNHERVGSLEEQPQLGGDSAALQPKKMLFGILSRFMNKGELSQYFSGHEVMVYSKQLREKYNVYTTTSAGRILDAVSALLGVCERRTFEGEPAIRLEQFAAKKGYGLDPVIEKGDRWIVGTTELFRFLVKNLGRDKRRLAATAQRYIARGLHTVAAKFNKDTVFAGGVAHNKAISQYLFNQGVLLNRDFPRGDAGICFGQLYLANIQ